LGRRRAHAKAPRHRSERADGRRDPAARRSRGERPRAPGLGPRDLGEDAPERGHRARVAGQVPAGGRPPLPDLGWTPEDGYARLPRWSGGSGIPPGRATAEPAVGERTGPGAVAAELVRPLG